MASSSKRKKHIPGSEVKAEEVFSYPFLIDEPTVEYITDHKRIMFVIRGPPGTGKTSLSLRFKDVYPTTVVCSADDYFDALKRSRTREDLSKSHEFCRRKVETECKNGISPVVVQNTNIRRWHIDEYLDFANRYGYTVIMANTLRVFEVDPKILAATNTKGLDIKYFQGVLQVWQEYVPKYIAWFFSPEDCTTITHEAKSALNSLLNDGKFCNTFDVFSEEDIDDFFLPEEELFCPATYCDHGAVKGTYQFYLSDAVQENYGKCFELSILGFLVTKDSVLAVVNITKDMEPFIFMRPQQKDLNDIVHKMSNININDGKTTVQGNSENKPKSENSEENELMNINHMSFIIVAGEDKVSSDLKQYAKAIFSTIANRKGVIEEKEFSEFDDGTRYCRLPHYMWLILKKISVSSVLTGLYKEKHRTKF